MDNDVKICTWTQVEEDHNAWETECKNIFIIEDGTPGENGMNFCCFCGKQLKEHLYYQ